MVTAATTGLVLACTPAGPSPSSTSTTAPATTAPPVTFPAPTCGTYYAASGWPTTMMPSPTLWDCILDAFASGTPATFAERYQTDGFGGHIRIFFYEVTGVQEVRVTVDSTGAEPPGGVTTEVCTSLDRPGTSGLVVSGCTSAAPA